MVRVKPLLETFNPLRCFVKPPRSASQAIYVLLGTLWWGLVGRGREIDGDSEKGFLLRFSNMNP